MAVHHNKQRRFFVSIDANIVRGNALSLPALGLLTVLLDRPAWWEVYAVEIARTLGVELLTLQPLFAELEQKGFVRMRRGERGPCYDVYENPMPPSQTAPPPEPPPAPKPEPERIEPEAPAAPKAEWLRDFQYPDPSKEGEPMSDRNRAYALQYIREHFPVIAKKHDLNEAIRNP